MQKWRNLLLKKNDIDTYRKVQEYFNSPKTEIFDIILTKFSNEDQEELRNGLSSIAKMYREDRQSYFSKIIEGQAIIWDEVLHCYEDVCNFGVRFDQHNCTIYPENFVRSAKELQILCELYSKMQARVSALEEVLGVDRFLDRISEDTFKILTDVIDTYKTKLNLLSFKHKECFQKGWNTTSISKIIYHKLFCANADNQICDLFRTNQAQIILFVIDGFGYCQYLWHRQLNSTEINYTYKENIFHWLSAMGVCKEYPLGSSFVTDTGAGLSQIFSGLNARETGIVASKLHRKESAETFFETKKLPQQQFESIFNANTNCITDVAISMGQTAKVYYCSKYPQTVSGFSNYIFKSAEIIGVLPPERVFSLLKSDIDNGMVDGLQVVYQTGIDNSGHTMGAYSKFEKFEHQKLNGLFRSFLIELAADHPELFDGKRSIMITADHGMAESARIMVNRNALRNYMEYNGIQDALLVENNRSLLIYGIAALNVDMAVTLLKNYFIEQHMDVDIISEKDDRFNNFFCTSQNDKVSQITPQIVVRLVSNGLFFSRAAMNQHLLHYGGHGGASIDEVFVPLIDIPLDALLYDALKTRFIDIY